MVKASSEIWFDRFIEQKILSKLSIEALKFSLIAD